MGYLLPDQPMLLDSLCWLDQIQPSHHRLVGEKAFYLGLLMQRGYPVLPGFVVPAPVFQQFLEQIRWLEPMFADLPNSSLHLDVGNPRQLQAVAQQIRQAIQSTPLPNALLTEIEAAVQTWQAPALMLRPSFSLQSGMDSTLSHRTTGLLEAHLCPIEPEAIAQVLRQTWAELFRARSLLYWQRLGIQLQQVHLAVLVQPIQSAIASGDVRVQEGQLEIRATWGLGTALVRGEVMPDRYEVHPQLGVQASHPGRKIYAYKIASPTESASSPVTDVTEFSGDDDHYLHPYLIEPPQQTQAALTDDQLQQLIHLIQQASLDLGMVLELEWTLCTDTENHQPKLYFTQVTPQLSILKTGRQADRAAREAEKGSGRNSKDQKDQTVASGTSSLPLTPLLSRSTWLNTPSSFQAPLVGLAAAPGKAYAQAWVVDSEESAAAVPPGVILVTSMVMPDHLISLRQLAGVVTEQGGMTSHGAILAREVSIPAVVGVDQVTRLVKTGIMLFIDGDRGEVYPVEELPFTELSIPEAESASSPAVYFSRPPVRPKSTLVDLPLTLSPLLRPNTPTATQLWVTLSQPDSIPQLPELPVDGVGLLRSELMILQALEHRHPNQWIHQGQQTELINRMANQIRLFADAFAPRPVFYRSLDLRSHEFPAAEMSQPETNPMLGVRGTFSYQINPALFGLELTALRQAQQQGYTNLNLVLPFVRTVEEFTFCRQLIEQAGLILNPHFQLWIMAEVPSVLMLLPDYVKAGVQGIAIGTNDLTQLLLGVDRDHHAMATVFDQRHPAVLRAIHQLIQTARQSGIPCSICGQAPSQHPEIIDSLVRWGITAISVEPNALETTYGAIVRAEQGLLVEVARQQLNL